MIELELDYLNATLGVSYTMGSTGWIRRDLDLDKIKELYLVEKRSSKQIARMFNTSQQTIRRALQDINIPRRSITEANLVAWRDKTYETVILTERQHHIILGTLLGDAGLHIQKSSINPTFSVGHREADQEYTIWKFNELKTSGLFKNSPFTGVKRFEDGREFKSKRIRSIQHPILRDYHNLLYSDGRKRITSQVLDQCNLLSLAAYYMDDGGLRRAEWYDPDSPKIPCFYTYSYTEEEILLLRYFLDNRWGIHSELKEIKYGVPRKVGNLLLVGERSVPRFQELIIPYILPIQCMHRKIP